jgi:hypothetical protein
MVVAVFSTVVISCLVLVLISISYEHAFPALVDPARRVQCESMFLPAVCPTELMMGRLLLL